MRGSNPRPKDYESSAFILLTCIYECQDAEWDVTCTWNGVRSVITARSRTLWRVEWWQTLAISVLTPAVTAAALLWQNAVNNRRDDKRRVLEASERDRDRRYVVIDQWRGERKVAHAALLADFEAAADELSRQLSRISNADVPVGLADEVTQEVREHFAAVQILSLPSTRTVAEEAFKAFNRADMDTWAYLALSDDPPTEDDKRSLKAPALTAVEELRKASAIYLDAVRKEIGTEESAE